MRCEEVNLCAELNRGGCHRHVSRTFTHHTFENGQDSKLPIEKGFGSLRWRGGGVGEGEGVTYRVSGNFPVDCKWKLCRDISVLCKVTVA